jgi:hypothetical protein
MQMEGGLSGFIEPSVFVPQDRIYSSQSLLAMAHDEAFLAPQSDNRRTVVTSRSDPRVSSACAGSSIFSRQLGPWPHYANDEVSEVAQVCADKYCILD